MFDSDAMRELQELKADVSRVLSTASEGIFDASKESAEALVDQIKAAFSDLAEALSQEEEQVKRLVSDRPIASIASAFALGVVVGLMLRRH
jgi:ElaB/YqjD/DUF883 family membrane-anchored ribosome-binding protein